MPVGLDEDPGGRHDADEVHEAVDDVPEMFLACPQHLFRPFPLGDVGRDGENRVDLARRGKLRNESGLIASQPRRGFIVEFERQLASADHRLLEDRLPEIAELRRHAGLAAGLAQERFGRKPRGPLDGRIDVNMTKFGVEASDDVRHALDERPELAILSLQRGALLLEPFLQLEPLDRILYCARQAVGRQPRLGDIVVGAGPKSPPSPPCTPPRSQ